MNVGRFKCKIGNRFFYSDGYSIQLIDAKQLQSALCAHQTHIISVSCTTAVCMYIQIQIQLHVNINILCHQLCVRQSVLNKQRVGSQNFILVVNYFI